MHILTSALPACFWTFADPCFAFVDMWFGGDVCLHMSTAHEAQLLHQRTNCLVSLTFLELPIYVRTLDHKLPPQSMPFGCDCTKVSQNSSSTDHSCSPLSPLLLGTAFVA